MSQTVDIQLSKIPQRNLQEVIASQSNTDDLQSIDVRITEADGQHYIGAGLHQFRRIDIVGSLGDYACAGIDNCECFVDGNVADYLAYSIRSGVVIVKGHARHSVGAMGASGFVSVYGNAGDRVGVSLRGADVFVRANAGALAGYQMRSGTIIIGGSAGPGMGTAMSGGTIYLRGEAAEISPDIEEHRQREPDRLKLGLLLLKAGIKGASGKEFRIFRSIHEKR